MNGTEEKGANGAGANGAGATASVPLPRVASNESISTTYSNAASVNSEAINSEYSKHLQDIDEIASFITRIIGFAQPPERDETAKNFRQIKKLKSKDYTIEIVSKVKSTLNEDKLSIFENYRDDKINKAISNIKKFVMSLGNVKTNAGQSEETANEARYKHDKKYLNCIRDNIFYILDRTSRNLIGSSKKEKKASAGAGAGDSAEASAGAGAGAGAGSEGGYRKRRSTKKVKRSRRRLTRRR